MADVQIDPVDVSVVNDPGIFIVGRPDPEPTDPIVKIVAEAPKVIVVEQLSDRGRANLAANPKLAQQVANEATAGLIHETGVWMQDPGGQWPIEKLGVGQYKVTHNWGFSNLCLSVNIGLSRGTARIVENAPTYFRVDTYVDRVPADAPFVFSLTRMISPPPSSS